MVLVFNFVSALTHQNKLQNLHVTLLFNSIPDLHKLSVAQIQRHQSLFSRPRPIREKGVACESTSILASFTRLFLGKEGLLSTVHACAKLLDICPVKIPIKH